jgi:hypothetical protein
MAVIDAFEASFVDFVEPLTLLSPTGTSINMVRRSLYDLPTDENAHRETAVRFVMIDENLNQASFSIGGPNLAAFPFTVGDGGDVYQWGSGTQGAALEDFVDAVVLIARHPVSGLALTMQRLELVGRSN